MTSCAAAPARPSAPSPGTPAGLQPQGSFVFAIHLYQDYRGSRHVHDKHESRAAAARVNVERDLVP